MVFDTKKYKDFAKKQLNGRWGVPILITITLFVIGEIFSIPNYIAIFRSPAGSELLNGNWSTFKEFSLLIDQATQTNTPILIDIIQFLVAAILQVAAISVYLKMSRSPEKVYFKDFIEGLNNWWRAILSFLWMFLWVFLWTCLLIIPGIIKAIAYSQTWYLINEYDNLSIRKAMKISNVITKGHKGDLFICFISFFGWFLISCLTLGVANLWLKPYMRMTFINAYHAMMKDALETGIIRPEDLQ